MALIITPQVLKQMKVMPKADQRRIFEAFELVAADIPPHHSFVTEMVGEAGVWRLRKAEWRALYTVKNGDVVVRKIGNREDIYQ